MPIIEPTALVTPAEQAASRIRDIARKAFADMTIAFSAGAAAFWKNPRATPSEIAAALGRDGREAFELHAKIGELLASISPEYVERVAEMVGDFSYNEDGSVSVASTPQSEG